MRHSSNSGSRQQRRIGREAFQNRPYEKQQLWQEEERNREKEHQAVDFLHRKSTAVHDYDPGVGVAASLPAGAGGTDVSTEGAAWSAVAPEGIDPAGVAGTDGTTAASAGAMPIWL